MAYSKHQIWFTKQHSVDCWLCWGRKLSSHTNRIDNRHCRPPLWCLALHEMLSIISGGNFCLWVWLAGLHIQHHLHQREVTLGSKGQSEKIAVIYQRCSQKSDLAPSSNIFSEVRRSELLPIIIMNSLHMTLVDQGLCKVNHLLLSENKIIKILVFETINYRRCSSENDKWLMAVGIIND